MNQHFVAYKAQLLYAHYIASTVMLIDIQLYCSESNAKCVDWSLTEMNNCVVYLYLIRLILEYSCRFIKV